MHVQTKMMFTFNLLFPNVCILIYLLGIRVNVLLYVALVGSVILGAIFLLRHERKQTIKHSPEDSEKKGENIDQLTPLIKQLADVAQRFSTFKRSIYQAKDTSADILEGANIQTSNVEKSTETMNDISSSIQHIASTIEVVASQSKSTRSEERRVGKESRSRWSRY